MKSFGKPSSRSMLVFIIRNWKNEITAILVLENYANKCFLQDTCDNVQSCPRSTLAAPKLVGNSAFFSLDASSQSCACLRLPVHCPKTLRL